MPVFACRNNYVLMWKCRFLKFYKNIYVGILNEDDKREKKNRELNKKKKRRNDNKEISRRNKLDCMIKSRELLVKFNFFLLSKNQ